MTYTSRAQCPAPKRSLQLFDASIVRIVSLHRFRLSESMSETSAFNADCQQLMNKKRLSSRDHQDYFWQDPVYIHDAVSCTAMTQSEFVNISGWSPTLVPRFWCRPWWVQAVTFPWASCSGWTSIPRSWLFHFAQKTLRLSMVGSTEERKWFGAWRRTDPSSWRNADSGIWRKALSIHRLLH